MDCKEAGLVLAAFVDGECFPDEARDLQAHLSSCAACRARRAALEAARSAFSALPPDPVSAGFAAELSRRISSFEKPASSLPLAGWKPAMALAAALLLLVLGTRGRQPAPGGGGAALGWNIGRAGSEVGSPCSSLRDCG